MDESSVSEIESRINNIEIFPRERYEHYTITAIEREPLPKLTDAELYQKGFAANKLRQEQSKCPLTEGELLSLRLVFSAWTGIDGDGPTQFGDQWVYFDEEMMLNELNEVRNFCKNDLNPVFGLTGVMAEINETLFMQDLEPYSEEDLTTYANLFHIDLSFLMEFQEGLMSDFYAFIAQDGVTEEQIKTLEDFNETRLITELKMIILDFRIKMIDMFRLWRWREQVLFQRSADEFDEYPGVETHHYFETAAELHRDGIEKYFLRVGEARRETLMEFFNFVELYHMAGLLSVGVQQEVKFQSDMRYEDVADLIILLIDKMKLNPRHMLSPIGVRIIRNLEEPEIDFNMHHLLEIDDEKLSLACSQAGIEISRETEIVEETRINSETGEVEEITSIRREQKPSYVLMEELAANMVSPQFYSAVENHRDWKSVVTSIKTVVDSWLLSALEGEIVFYGVGDGMSMYRVYKPMDLAKAFSEARNFVDPYSIQMNPDETSMWTTFSNSSIQRLLMITIPMLQKKANKISDPGRKERALQGIAYLGDVIVYVFDHLERVGDDNPIILSGEERQEEIIKELRIDMDMIRPQLGLFFAYLFNLGSQFSDWNNMIDTSARAQQMGILQSHDYKMVDPETTDNLTTKLYRMLCIDFEKYLMAIKFEPDAARMDRLQKGEDVIDMSRHVSSLRLIKHYQGAYRIDWDDDRMTIGGQIHRMLKYADLGLYPQLQTCGNWLMATSQYYSINLLDDDPSVNALDIFDGTVDGNVLFG